MTTSDIPPCGCPAGAPSIAPPKHDQTISGTQGGVVILRRLIAPVGLLTALVPLLLAVPTSASAANCQFVLGFQTLQRMIPDKVGDCQVDVHYNAYGDAVQETAGPTGAGGLLVWRKADNWTAFTDGYHTWINGPYGLQERLNAERFSWEQAETPPAPPPTPVSSLVINGNGMAITDLQSAWGRDSQGNYMPVVWFTATNTAGVILPFNDDRIFLARSSWTPFTRLPIAPRSAAPRNSTLQVCYRVVRVW